MTDAFVLQALGFQERNDYNTFIGGHINHSKHTLTFFTLFFLAALGVSAQDQDAITRAIRMGDLETLYNFVQNPHGTERWFISSAEQTIKRYAAADKDAEKYRTNKMETRTRSVSPELMGGVFTDPKQHLPAVVARLISGLNDPFMKVKVIHDWICDNIAYDIDHFFGMAYNSQDYISVIKNKKGVCSGYASVFNQMCSIAGIESIRISGYSKGAGYTGYIGDFTDHEWNAVMIGGRWYLVDVTWDAGYLVLESWVKKYTTHYLFLDSRSFLYSHLPKENRHQYYAPPLTKEQFMDEPYIAGNFFRYALEVKPNLPRYDNPVHHGYSLQVTNKNSNITVGYDLRTVHQQDVEGAAWHQTTGNTMSIVFDVPDTREYKAYIFARFKNERRITERISINRFEQELLPMLDTLIENKKITEAEKDHFIQSYYKVENEYYYFREDLFDTPRNNAVIKIHPMVGLSLNTLEAVLGFNLKAAPSYTGYRHLYISRFPTLRYGAATTSNTLLVSPIKGELRAETSETFLVNSRDYSIIALTINGEHTLFEKNKDGAFELTLEIPPETEMVEISGAKSGKNFSPLFRYTVKPATSP